MNCRVSQTCASLSSWTTSRASPRTSSSNWPSGRTWAVAHTTPAHPPFSYFVHVPTSLSLIGPSQLVQCLASVQISNLTHGEPRSRIAGATGPSQGLVSAVAISASHSFDSTLPMSSELRSASESVVFVVERHSQFSPSSLEFATAKAMKELPLPCSTLAVSPSQHSRLEPKRQTIIFPLILNSASLSSMARTSMSSQAPLGTLRFLYRPQEDPCPSLCRSVEDPLLPTQSRLLYAVPWCWCSLSFRSPDRLHRQVMREGSERR